MRVAAGSARSIGRRYRSFLFVLILLLGGLTGCGAKVHVVPFSPAEHNLKHIAMAYGDATSQLGRPPKNAEELKRFLKEFGNPEELLVSPNDGQEYVIIWGVNPSGGPTEYKQMFPILAYERQGKGGYRAVTDVRGRPMNVPVEDFPKLTFVGGHKPS